MMLSPGLISRKRFNYNQSFDGLGNASFVQKQIIRENYNYARIRDIIVVCRCCCY